VRQELGELIVTVSDDGPGSAELNSPDALAGLRDRLVALGGSLDASSDDRGTTQIGRIPCG
jgi:signal transduction histidine kinase